MWNVEPKHMCNQHILGEHLEMHMFIGTMKKGTSLKGFINKGLVDLTLVGLRHDELVKEMKKRGINHKTPIPDYTDLLIVYEECGKVDVLESQRILFSRCPECFKRFKEYDKS
jgi:hypothetical protein